MDIIVAPSIFKYLTKLLDRTTPMKQISDHVPCKPLFSADNELGSRLERARPEDKGISSFLIGSFLHEVKNVKKLDLHGVMIVKDGAVICDAAFEGHNSNVLHVWHSLSKSVTSMAIGMLIDEGQLSLDDKPIKILEKKVGPFAALGYRNLTVRHLLTMTSGASFAEVGTVVEKNWLRAYFESGVTFQHGKKFNYNSLNSYVLSCIVKEISGQGLCDYLKPRLFDPLGIKSYHWEKSPEDIENGGWGLYLKREDVAKLAQLYLDNGVWHGKRIISEKWIKASTTPFVKTPDEFGEFDYGFHVWCNKDKNSFLFNGMFCQDALVLRKQRIIIVTNGGVEQLFQQSEYYDIIDRYFYIDNPHIPYRIKMNRIIRTLKGKKAKRHGTFFKKKLPKNAENVLGRIYYSSDVNDAPFKSAQKGGSTASYGILPITEQLVRNSYSTGIQSLCLRREDNRLYIDFEEGEGIKRLPLVPGKSIDTVLKFGITEYRASVISGFSKDEIGTDVLVIKVTFPEISSTRYIKVYFKGDRLDVSMSESPGLGLVWMFADEIERVIRKNKTIADVVSILDSDSIFLKLEKRFEPHFTLFKDIEA